MPSVRRGCGKVTVSPTAIPTTVAGNEAVTSKSGVCRTAVGEARFLTSASTVNVSVWLIGGFAAFQITEVDVWLDGGGSAVPATNWASASCVRSERNRTMIA